MESDVLRSVARYWPHVDEVIPDRDQQQWYRRKDRAEAHRDPPAADDQRGQPAECAIHNLLRRQTHGRTAAGFRSRRGSRKRAQREHGWWRGTPSPLASHAPLADRTSCSPSRSLRGASPSFPVPSASARRTNHTARRCSHRHPQRCQPRRPSAPSLPLLPLSDHLGRGGPNSCVLAAALPSSAGSFFSMSWLITTLASPTAREREFTVYHALDIDALVRTRAFGGFCIEFPYGSRMALRECLLTI